MNDDQDQNLNNQTPADDAAVLTPTTDEPTADNAPVIPDLSDTASTDDLPTIEESTEASNQEEIAPDVIASEEKEATETEETKETKETNITEDGEQTADDESTEPSDDGSSDLSKANPNARWYVVHTFAGHENRVATTLKQRVEAEHLENKIYDVLVPTQDKIEIRGGKKETVKEKIFPGYILVKMELDDISWLAVRTTQGVTSFVGAGNKPTPISEKEVASIVRFTSQGATPTFKDVFMIGDTVKIADGPFTDFIGKVDTVDKEKGRLRILVSIFGRETPVELDFLQVTKL